MVNSKYQESTYSSSFLVAPLRVSIPILRFAFWTVACITIFFAVVPSLYLFIWSLWGTEIVGVMNKTLSMQWYLSFLKSQEWRESFLYSLVLATLVSLMGCMILSIHFYFMRYAPPFIERIAYAITILPIIIPAVIFAIALRIIGAKLLVPEVLMVFSGHLIFVIPMQFFIFESAQETISTNLLFAGNSLGANHFRNIVFNYVPLLFKAIRASFLVGFFYSFDELVIATFVIDSSLVTIPRRLWDQVPRSMEPNPAVVASLLLIFYLIFVFAALVRKLIVKFSKTY